jgi:UDP-glucose 4-epimerase
MPDAVIVLGAGGFVGRHLVNALVIRGYTVIALMRRECAMPPGVEAHIGDFDASEHYAALLPRARAIIHAASDSTPGSTAGRPLAEIDANLRPTLALLAALQERPQCRLLYVSSGGTLYGDTQDRPAREDDVLRPRSYYGAGKAAAEYFIYAASQQFGLTATLLRPSNLYGPGQGLRSGFGIIPTAFVHARSGVPLTLWGDGSAVRDYLYIDDFIRLCGDIIEQPMLAGARTLNVASGQGTSLIDLIAHVRRITGTALPVRHDLSRPVDIARIELDTREVARIYGWMPRVGLDEGLQLSWRWWQEQQA